MRIYMRLLRTMINDEDSCHMHWHRCSPAMAVPIIIIAVAEVAIAKIAHVTFWSNDAIHAHILTSRWQLESFILSSLFFFRLFSLVSLTAATGWKRKSALGSKRDKASHGISKAHRAQDGGNQ